MFWVDSIYFDASTDTPRKDLDFKNSHSSQMSRQSLVHQVPREFRAPPAPLVFKALLVPLVIRGLLVPQEQQDHPAPQGLQVLRALMVFRDPPAHRGPGDSAAYVARPAHLGGRGRPQQ